MLRIILNLTAKPGGFRATRKQLRYAPDFRGDDDNRQTDRLLYPAHARGVMMNQTPAAVEPEDHDAQPKYADDHDVPADNGDANF